jgi:hypothetical protein
MNRALIACVSLVTVLVGICLGQNSKSVSRNDRPDEVIMSVLRKAHVSASI